MSAAFITAYFGVALCDLAADGAICAAHKRKFRWQRALAAAIFWPVTLPLTIIASAVLTKECEDWKSDDIPMPDILRRTIDGANQ